MKTKPQSGFSQHHFLSNISDKKDSASGQDVSFHKVKSMKSGAGFTLIELLVVVSITSLIASILLVATLGARSKAKDAERQATTTQLSGALELYYADHDSYPVGTFYSGWDSGDHAAGNHHCWCTDANNSLENYLVKGGYLAKLPEDPNNAEGTGNYLNDGVGRGYMIISDGQSYVIGTYLETLATPPPTQNSVAVCMAAGNHQISSGTLNPALCPGLANPPPNPVCSVDVTPNFVITKGKMQYLQMGRMTVPGVADTYSYHQMITLSNSGTDASGPVSLVVSGLPSGVTLTNATGNTVCFSPTGQPFVIVAANGIPAGGNASITLTFSSLQNVDPTFNLNVAAGNSGVDVTVTPVCSVPVECPAPPFGCNYTGSTSCSCGTLSCGGGRGGGGDSGPNLTGQVTQAPTCQQDIQHPDSCKIGMHATVDIQTDPGHCPNNAMCMGFTVQTVETDSNGNFSATVPAGNYKLVTTPIRDTQYVNGIPTPGVFFNIQCPTISTSLNSTPTVANIACDSGQTFAPISVTTCEYPSPPPGCNYTANPNHVNGQCDSILDCSNRFNNQ